MQQHSQEDVSALDSALQDEFGAEDFDIEMDAPEMGLDFVGNEEAVRQLFASEQDEQEEQAQAQVKQASVRTLGTVPSGTRTLPNRVASAKPEGLEGLWESKPDISSLFR